MSNDDKESYRSSRVLSVPRGNPSPKLAISVDPDVHRGIVEAAQADGMTVSAWMTQAAHSALHVRDGLAAIAEWEADHGELTADEMAHARDRIRQQASQS